MRLLKEKIIVRRGETLRQFKVTEVKSYFLTGVEI